MAKSSTGDPNTVKSKGWQYITGSQSQKEFSLSVFPVSDALRVMPCIDSSVSAVTRAELSSFDGVSEVKVFFFLVISLHGTDESRMNSQS